MGILGRAQPKTAFVLSGGGNLGALQVGMLRALVEEEITPDVVLGCSVGAMNGAAYCSAPTLAGIRRMERIWTDAASPNLMPTSWVPSALQLIRKGEALHSNEGLIATIDRLSGKAQTFADLVIPFQCVATDVSSVLEVWFSQGELLKPILASAALPAVFPPVTIEGRRYIDGGVVDNVPIQQAIKLGCERLYVLHVGKQGQPESAPRRPIDAALQAYWVARNNRYARDLAALPEGCEAVLLPTGERPEVKYDDFSRTPELIEQGYAATADFLAQRSAELEAQRSERSWRRRWSRLRAHAMRSISDAQDAADDPQGAMIIPGPPATNGDSDTRSSSERANSSEKANPGPRRDSGHRRDSRNSADQAP